MITLLRKIRKNMLNKGKFSKYLLYALGEIFLVVIGILIALQINTWSENRKNRQIEKDYLNGILRNLDEDIISYKDNIEQDTLILNYMTVLQKAFTDENIRSDKVLMNKVILLTISYNQFSSSRTVFEDMVSSGKINLIKADTLRQALTNYYQFVDGEAAFDLNQEVTEWREHKMEMYNGRLSLHAIMETYLYSKEWRGVIHDFDLSFFTTDANDVAVRDFAYHLSSMKVIMRGKHNRVHIQGLRKAEQLKKEIEDYLNIPQEDTTGNPQTISKNKAFEPTSPKNQLLVSEDMLQEYKGEYKLVKKSNTKDTPEEYPLKTNIRINPIDDYLATNVSNLVQTSFSLYCVEKDKFKRALSFLFSDEGSKGIITFSRDANNNIDGFSLEVEQGIFEYNKITQ